MLLTLAKYVWCGARNLCDFRVARSGATLVEFAIIAPAFLGTLIAIFATTTYLFAQQVLQTAATQAGRALMTGQAQTSNWKSSDLLNQVICPVIQALLNCSQVQIDVQSASSFDGIDTSVPTAAQIANPNWSFNPGGPDQVVVIRLFYQWSTVNGPLGFTLANLPNNAALIMGVAAFKVEPYPVSP
jgi:Flp pilus assembly protein TadG